MYVASIINEGNNVNDATHCDYEGNCVDDLQDKSRRDNLLQDVSL